jgi:AcrR family transcriptional regulator
VPKKVDHDERKRELVEAAWRVIAAKGIDDVTTREVARESGYSHGVLAHYFPTKDELLLAALEHSHQRIDARYEQETADVPVYDALRAVLTDNLPEDDQRRLETRIEMSFWERALNNPKLLDVQRRESAKLQGMLRELIEQSRRDGNISPDVDTDDALALLAGLIDGLSLHKLLYPDRVPDGRATELMETLLTLLRPRTPARRAPKPKPSANGRSGKRRVSR